MNTYLVVTFVLFVKVGGADMMTIVPVDIGEASIISLCHHDLLFSDFEAGAISELRFSHLEDLLGSLGANR